MMPSDSRAFLAWTAMLASLGTFANLTEIAQVDLSLVACASLLLLAGGLRWQWERRPIRSGPQGSARGVGRSFIFRLPGVVAGPPPEVAA